MSKNDNKSNKIWAIANVVILAIMFGIMCFGVVHKLFWYDEMATIGFISSDVSVKGVFMHYLTDEVTNLPLYALLVYPFYHLLPPADIWLLLPGMLLTVGAVWIMARMADRFISRRAGYIVLIMAVCSTTIISRIGLFLRAYSLMLFVAALGTYLFFIMIEKQDAKSIFKFGVSGFLMLFTHYFSVLYFALLGCVTLLFIILKKCNWRLLLAYIIPGITFVPWFILAMSKRTREVGSFWIAPPNLKSIGELFGFQLGKSYIMCALYGIAFLLLIYVIIKNKKWLSLESFLVVMPMAIIGLIFVYSRWINPEGGLFENRYFNVIIPHVFLAIAYLIDYVLNKAKVFVVGGLVIFATAQLLCIRSTYTDLINQYDRFYFAGKYIRENANLEKDNEGLIIITYDDMGNVVYHGWYDYYIVRRGITPKHCYNFEGGTGIEKYMDSNIDTLYVVGDEGLAMFLDGFELVNQWSFERISVYKKCD